MTGPSLYELTVVRYSKPPDAERVDVDGVRYVFADDFDTPVLTTVMRARGSGP